MLIILAFFPSSKFPMVSCESENHRPRVGGMHLPCLGIVAPALDCYWHKVVPPSTPGEAPQCAIQAPSNIQHLPLPPRRL